MKLNILKFTLVLVSGIFCFLILNAFSRQCGENGIGKCGSTKTAPKKTRPKAVVSKPAPKKATSTAIRRRPRYTRVYDANANTGYYDDNSNANVSDDSSDSDTSEEIPQGVNVGVVNSRAINLVKPAYPQAAKQVGAAGQVTVQVSIDQEGNVVAAKAISGHPLLRQAAENAARQSLFNPIKINDKPINVFGVIVYNFVAQ